MHACMQRLIQMAVTNHLIMTFGQMFDKSYINHYVSIQRACIRQQAALKMGVPCVTAFTLCDTIDLTGRIGWSLIMRDGNDVILTEIMKCIRTGLQLYGLANRTGVAHAEGRLVSSFTWVEVFEREQALLDARIRHEALCAKELMEFRDALESALQIIERPMDGTDDMVSMERFVEHLCSTQA